jgi:hypothetical protein
MRLHSRCPESRTKSFCLAIVSSNAVRVVRITNKVLPLIFSYDFASPVPFWNKMISG